MGVLYIHYLPTGYSRDVPADTEKETKVEEDESQGAGSQEKGVREERVRAGPSERHGVEQDDR